MEEYDDIWLGTNPFDDGEVWSRDKMVSVDAYPFIRDLIVVDRFVMYIPEIELFETVTVEWECINHDELNDDEVEYIRYLKDTYSYIDSDERGFGEISMISPIFS